MFLTIIKLVKKNSYLYKSLRYSYRSSKYIINFIEAPAINLYRYLRRIVKKFLYTHPNPYEFISLYPNDIEVTVIDQQYKLTSKFPKYTIITPVLNEERTIEETLNSIESQTLLPDQVIIVDGGSNDSTVKKIQNYQQNSKLDIVLLFSPRKNIGYQRNMAIKEARNNIIMNVDSGTYLDIDYSANAIGPFVEDSNLDLLSGVHYPKRKYIWSYYLSPAKHFESRVEPYGACLVYKKTISEKIGNYPEYLTYAGEDTLFCYKYKKLSKKWVFNKKAFILWEHPKSLVDTQQKVANYMMANFEIGLWPYFYYQYICEQSYRNILNLDPFQGQYINFLKKQSKIETSVRNIKGLCFLFLYQGINNITPNQEVIETTLSFIKNSYKTFIINFKHLKAKNNQKKRLFLNTDHTLLEFIYYKFFSTKEFDIRYGNFLNNSLFIIQFINRKTYEDITKLKESLQNIIIVYDTAYVSKFSLNPEYIGSVKQNDIMKKSDWILVTQNFLDNFKKINSRKQGIQEIIKKFIIINDQEHKIKILHNLISFQHTT